MSRVRLAMGVLAMTGALGLASCAADPSDVQSSDGSQSEAISNKISGSVSEWKVDVSSHTAEAGEVIFAIANFGSMPHEFIVVKTDYEPGKIPLGENNRFDEEGEGITAIDELKEWPVNQAGVLKVNLDEGKYQLLCNIAGHYEAGMYTEFNVVKGDGESSSMEGATSETSEDGDKVSNDITGSVAEWSVGVSANEAKAGDVKFTMKNAGSIPHEFIIVKTDFAPGEIPLGTNNRFDEEGEGLEVIGEIPEWDAGTTDTVTLNLTAGKYQLLCNIEGHYKNGMYVPFTVST